MGTTASLHVNDAVSDAQFAEVASIARVELERLESIFTVFRPESDISRINDGSLHHLDASSEVIEVLDHCAWLEQVSRGAFSIRRSRESAEINPSGFVKGWAGERVANLLRAQGLQHFYLGIGGDYALTGGMTADEPWRIGIIDPRDASQLVGTVDAVSGAIATSGTAERGKHIWDPRTGTAATSFLSVTVVGPQLMWADAYATTVFVMGEAGLDWICQFDGYSVLPVREND
jgi:thiamine biosynthesis lipoprotein